MSFYVPKTMSRGTWNWKKDKDKKGHVIPPKPSKSWLIVKPAFIDEANTLFDDVNITDKGHRYLGSYIGAEAGLAEFIED